MPAERTVERLRRILVLVPWVMTHPGCTVDEVCERFGMKRGDLVADLEMLFVCGVPPFGPGDLIVAFVQEDQVVVQMADYLSSPPRLTRAEAIGLLVAGRAITALPGFEEAESLRGALKKLERAIVPGDVDDVREAASRIEVDLATAGLDLLGDLRVAIDERRRLRIRYFSRGRSEMTEREIDPLLLLAAAGAWYLVAFDHHSGEERTFRVDRIRDAARTDATFTMPAHFNSAQYAAAPLFTPSPHDCTVIVDVGPDAGWLLEAIPHEAAPAPSEGWARMRIRTSHFAWLVRLLLAAGPTARAVEPPIFAEQVREAARRGLARYEARDD
ncbi:MAG: WYL domain-containing protein [Actinomycetota bacterium]